jgi:drug/metabolite transporter (DMT)-like permease
MTDNPAQPRPVGAATLTGVLAILLWAGLALLTAASGAVPPFELAALTFAIGGGFGLVFAAARGKLGALVQPWPVWLVGVGGLFGYHALYFAALRRAPPAQASLIACLWPLLIVLFSALLPGERLAARHIVGAPLPARSRCLPARAGCRCPARAWSSRDMRSRYAAPSSGRAVPSCRAG